MDIKSLTSAILEIAEQRGIVQKKVIEIIEMALASAYKKEYGKKKEKYEAELDPKTGEVKFWQIKEVVSEKDVLTKEEIEEFKKKQKPLPEKKIIFNSERYILLKEAKKIDPKIKKEEKLRILMEPKEKFGRIAAQTAKQVIIQRIKEAEKEIILKDSKEKEGEIVSGIIQRVGDKVVYFDIGRISGVLPKSEQIPGEFYQIGKRLKVYVLKVEDTPKGPLVILSRAYPKFVSKLFEAEVPEISIGQVAIKAIAREPGSRTKIAVAAIEKNIDPIGALVGQRGIRIMTVTNELGGEKIDVIKWSEKPEEYVMNSLSPAKVFDLKILPKNKIVAYIAPDQLSLAIGQNGQNVRLAAKLTGWKIDIRPIEKISTETEEEKLTEEEEKKEKEKTKE